MVELNGKEIDSEKAIAKFKDKVAAELKQWLVDMQKSSSSAKEDFSVVVSGAKNLEELLKGSRGNVPETALRAAGEFFGLIEPSVVPQAPAQPSLSSPEDQKKIALLEVLRNHYSVLSDRGESRSFRAQLEKRVPGKVNTVLAIMPYEPMPPLNDNDYRKLGELWAQMQAPLDREKILKSLEDWMQEYRDARKDLGMVARISDNHAMDTIARDLEVRDIAVNVNDIKTLRRGKKDGCDLYYGDDDVFREVAAYLDTKKARESKNVYLKQRAEYSPFILDAVDVGKIKRHVKVAEVLKGKLDALLSNGKTPAIVDSREKHFALFSGAQDALHDFIQLAPKLCEVRDSGKREFSRTAKIIDERAVQLLKLRSNCDIQGDAKNIYDEVEKFYKTLPRVLQESTLRDMSGNVDLADADTPSSRRGSRTVIPYAERNEKRASTRQSERERQKRDETARMLEEILSQRRVAAEAREAEVKRKVEAAKRKQEEERKQENDWLNEAEESRQRQAKDEAELERNRKAKPTKKKALKIEDASTIAIPVALTRGEVSESIEKIKICENQLYALMDKMIEEKSPHIETLDETCGALFRLQQNLIPLNDQFVTKKAALGIVSSVIQHLGILSSFRDTHQSSEDAALRFASATISGCLAALPAELAADTLKTLFSVVENIKVEEGKER